LSADKMSSHQQHQDGQGGTLATSAASGYDSQAEDRDRASGSEDDYSDDGDEGTEGYKEGGYHPVHVGDIFNFRYVVLQKLGWGHFSTVWMCLDRARVDGSPQYVAMKVQKSAPHYREAAFDEIELLNCVKKASFCKEYKAEQYAHGGDRNSETHKNVVVLLDHFEHTGPNGRHVCMVFEMLGENLLSVIKKYDYKGIPLDIVKRYTFQICQGLDFLHRHASIIHTDLKPENLLISEPPPVPPEDFVKALVEMGPIKSKKAATTVTSAASGDAASSGKRKGNRKGKGKKGGKGDNRGGPAAAAGGGGSVEAKKRMKKRQKKKRQKANRKGGDANGDESVEAKGGTHGSSGHGHGSAGIRNDMKDVDMDTAAALALSAAEQAKEMMMMEKVGAS
jgi:serine/threonine-protein kinase SRPK3